MNNQNIVTATISIMIMPITLLIMLPFFCFGWIFETAAMAWRAGKAIAREQ